MEPLEQAHNPSCQTEHHSSESNFWADAYRNAATVGNNLGKGLANIVDCIEQHPVETIGGGLLAATAIYMTRGKILGEKAECTAAELFVSDGLESTAPQIAPMRIAKLKLPGLTGLDHFERAVSKSGLMAHPELKTPGSRLPSIFESADPKSGYMVVPDLEKPVTSLRPEDLRDAQKLSESMINTAFREVHRPQVRWGQGMSDLEKARPFLPSKSTINEEILKITKGSHQAAGSAAAQIPK